MLERMTTMKRRLAGITTTLAMRGVLTLGKLTWAVLFSAVLFSRSASAEWALNLRPPKTETATPS